MTDTLTWKKHFFFLRVKVKSVITLKYNSKVQVLQNSAWVQYLRKCTWLLFTTAAENNSKITVKVVIVSSYISMRV